MVKEFSKPQEARQLEARARARTLGVRVAVVVEASRYASHPPDPPRLAPAVRWPTVQARRNAERQRRQRERRRQG